MLKVLRGESPEKRPLSVAPTDFAGSVPAAAPAAQGGWVDIPGLPTDYDRAHAPLAAACGGKALAWYVLRCLQQGNEEARVAARVALWHWASWDPAAYDAGSLSDVAASDEKISNAAKGMARRVQGNDAVPLWLLALQYGDAHLAMRCARRDTSAEAMIASADGTEGAVRYVQSMRQSSPLREVVRITLRYASCLEESVVALFAVHLEDITDVPLSEGDMNELVSIANRQLVEGADRAAVNKIALLMAAVGCLDRLVTDNPRIRRAQDVCARVRADWGTDQGLRRTHAENREWLALISELQATGIEDFPYVYRPTPTSRRLWAMYREQLPAPATAE